MIYCQVHSHICINIWNCVSPYIKRPSCHFFEYELTFLCGYPSVSINLYYYGINKNMLNANEKRTIKSLCASNFQGKMRCPNWGSNRISPENQCEIELVPFLILFYSVSFQCIWSCCTVWLSPLILTEDSGFSFAQPHVGSNKITEPYHLTVRKQKVIAR